MIKQFNPHAALNKQQKAPTFTANLHDNGVVILNPQGGLCKGNPLAHASELGTCGGGQLTFVKKAAEGFAHKENFITALVGQQFLIGNGLGDQPFGKEYETEQVKDENNKPLKSDIKYARAPLTKGMKYIDKEEVGVGKDGKENVFYKNLTQKYMGQIHKVLEDNKMDAANIIGGYIDGYVAIRHNNEILKQDGETKMPHNVWILHSAGGPKFKNMVIKRADNNLVNYIAQTNEKNPEVITQDIVLKYTNELLDDHKFEFPSRILAEKIAFTDPTTKVVVNSPLERDEQIDAYPYKTKMEGVNEIDTDRIHVIPPGVDKKRFSRNPATESHIKNAKEIFNKSYQKDIPSSRKNLDKVLTAGRLDEKKNFHGIINAFVASGDLREKANLVLVINGKDNGINYLKMAQGLAKRVDKKEITEESAIATLEDKNTNKISNGKYLMELANIVNKNEKILNGVITSVSIPDGDDFGGLHIALGEEGKTVGGLNSTQEPYGLIPAEQGIANIPGPVAKSAGVFAELKDIVPGFNPNDPNDIAKAYLKTLDDKEQIKEPLKIWAEGKTWESWCDNVLNLAQKDGDISFKELKEKHPAVYSEPIDYTSEKFVNKGKKMIITATEEELAKGKDGAFKPVFENVEKLLKAQPSVMATGYSSMAGVARATSHPVTTVG